MKDSLAPSLVEYVNDHTILWFKYSNQYVITAKRLYSLIKAFLLSESKDQFCEACMELGYETYSTVEFFKEIGKFLEDCNIMADPKIRTGISFRNNHRQVPHYYQLDDNTIAVYYGSKELRQLVHPQMEHLGIPGDKKPILCVFDIYSHNNNLALFKDEMLIGSWPGKDYHLLQGKFAMQVLCALHNNEESDWMGTFHASTVAKNNQAIMIIGASGKGKSTFTSLLLDHGFEVIADDLTPILAKDTLLYPFPGGISVKEGAFDVLKTRISDFHTIPVHYINPYKGYVKYIAAPKSKGYLKGYPCKRIVSINYKADSKTKLESITVAQALNTLIPESWLAPKKKNAQQFLNWIKGVSFYELTYSDSKEAIDLFSSLLKE
jgi:hypothetical protein